MYRDYQPLGKEFAHFRKTGVRGACLVSGWNNLEAGFRNSSRYLGDTPRELGG